jgi:hypothetical protein
MSTGRPPLRDPRKQTHSTKQPVLALAGTALIPERGRQEIHLIRSDRQIRSVIIH